MILTLQYTLHTCQHHSAIQEMNWMNEWQEKLCHNSYNITLNELHDTWALENPTKHIMFHIKKFRSVFKMYYVYWPQVFLLVPLYSFSFNYQMYENIAYIQLDMHPYDNNLKLFNLLPVTRSRKVYFRRQGCFYLQFQFTEYIFNIQLLQK